MILNFKVGIRSSCAKSYGQLGKEIIAQHFTNLVRWKHLLPSIDVGISVIHPLSIVDFIFNILAPEAAIRLMMQDKGWTGAQPMQSPAWEAAWKDADQVRRSSIPLAARDGGQTTRMVSPFSRRFEMET